MPSADPSSNNSGLYTCSPYFHRLIRVLTPPPTPPPPTQFCEPHIQCKPQLLCLLFLHAPTPSPINCYIPADHISYYAFTVVSGPPAIQHTFTQSPYPTTPSIRQ
ncbi:hypothetical protein T02_3876 [Trichinella nativa]|uniref:Uncharacterized protein n=1 Tax=Trichinella nativa TaxID=6335 RepID=A0A0V1LK44_9BILA|nr:hypothetical protein T02_3876 [Trichinella nativa]